MTIEPPRSVHRRRGRYRRVGRSVVAAGLVAVSTCFGAGSAGAADLSGLTWSRLSPPTSPPALHDASSAYDPANGTVVVFGGVSAAGAPSDATWVWDGSTWHQAPVYGSAPAARSGASMAYDAALDPPQLILFGGRPADGTLLGDTWSWNGSSWYQVTTATSPSARYGAPMATDRQGRLVIFGGYGDASSTSPPTGASTTTTSTPAPSTSTTVAKGTSTTSRPVVSTTTTTAPSSTTTRPTDSTTTTTTDPTSTTSTLGPAAATTAPTASTPGPNSGSPPASAFVAGLRSVTSTSGARHVRRHPPTRRSVARRRTGAVTSAPVPAGPHVLAETWVLGQVSGADEWTRVTTSTSPPALVGASMTMDPRGNTVLFGGSTSAPGAAAAPRAVNATWVWNGFTWSSTQIARPPEARADATMADDPAVGGVVLFGGLGPYGVLSDTWVWTGTTWARPSPATPPAARRSAASAYDQAGNALLVFGGVGRRSSYLDDTVLLGPKRPTAVVTSPGGGNPSSPSTAAGSTTVSTRAATGAPTTGPPDRASSGVSPRTLEVGPLTQVRRGDVISLSGSGFLAHAVVVITFHSAVTTVGRTEADAQGGFVANVTVPQHAAPGRHHFEAVGRGPSGTTSLVTPVEVIGVSIATHLSRASVLALVGIAVAFPVASWFGVGLVMRVRRRPAQA